MLYILSNKKGTWQVEASNLQQAVERAADETFSGRLGIEVISEAERIILATDVARFQRELISNWSGLCEN
jgi:hypothetical protein